MPEIASPPQRGRRQILLRVARLFGSHTQPRRLMRSLLVEAQRAFLASGGAVSRWDDTQQVLVELSNTLPGESPRGGYVAIMDGVAGEAARRRESVIVNDPDELLREAPGLVALGVRSIVAVPMLHGGRLLGVVSIVSDDPNKQFSDEEAESLEMLGSIAASSLVALERNRAVEELRLQTERLRRLIETTSDAIVATDRSMRVVVWNRGAEDLYGWSRDEVLGKMVPFVPDDRREVMHELWGRVFNAGVAVANYEEQRLTRDGRRVPVLATLSPVREQFGTIVSAVEIAKDLSARQVLEDQRRLLALMEERDSIGMDLHDNTMQSLYGAVLAVGAADRLIEGGNVDQARLGLHQVIDQLNGTIQELRAFIFELDVQGSEFDNLRGGLAELAEEASRLALVHVDLAVDERADAILGPDIVSQLLTVAREATSNVIRHAAANELTLRVTLEDRHVLLDVIDNGRGFDVPDAQVRGRHGLANMSERVRRVGGELSLLSGEGKGTRVRIQLPVKEPTNA